MSFVDLNIPAAGLLQTESFEALQEKLHGAISWLGEFGVVIPSTRIHAYQRTFEELMNVYRSKDVSRANSEFAKYVSTLYEIHEIIEIYNGFLESGSGSYLQSRILKVAHGPENLLDEDSSSGNLARNTAFELIIASRLAAAGYLPIHYGSADIAIRVANRTVLFECKRPQSEKAIGKRLRDGHSQLRRRYAGQPCLRGIVAIDVSKAANPDFGALHYEGPKRIGRLMERLIDEYSSKYSLAIQKLARRKTIGVLFRISIMALPKLGGDSIAYCQEFGLNTLASLRETDKRLVKEIGEAIAKPIFARKEDGSSR